MATAAEKAGDELGRLPPPPPGVRAAAEKPSNLNPAAEEFIPAGRRPGGRLSADAPDFVLAAASPDFVLSADAPDFVHSAGSSAGLSTGGNENNQPPHRRRNVYNYGRRRVNENLRTAQKENVIRRTVYVSDVDQHVSEEELAQLFAGCGLVNDCRICGDPRSVRRFAFIEFADERAAKVALTLGGNMLGFSPVRVLPSKTAILPVNPRFLPQSADEKDMCTRTVYCTGIDKELTESDIKDFFQSACGEVSRLRLLGDRMQPTRIAFIEFIQAESAITALNCSGTMLGALPIRVSPSKTPVRTHDPPHRDNDPDPQGTI